MAKRFSLILEDALHERLEKLSEREMRSMQQQLVYMLTLSADMVEGGYAFDQLIGKERELRASLDALTDQLTRLQTRFALRGRLSGERDNG